MSRAGCRAAEKAWAALGLCALLGAGCSPVPTAAPQSPAKKREAPAPDTPALESATPEAQTSELDALDLDLRAANRHLEEQLQRKRAEAYRAEKRDRGEGERAQPTKPPVPKKKQPTRPPDHTGGKPPRPDPAPDADKDVDTFDQPVGVRGSPCDLACRALDSMRRSAERICAIAGETSARCQDAKRTVDRATERVRKAGCQCTQGSRELMSRASRRAFPRDIVCAVRVASRVGGEAR